MLQFCMFGGFEGPLSTDKKCCFTVFGGCTLRRPTLARQIMIARQVRQGTVAPPKLIFLTLFGSTEIKLPTLAEEYLDLREAIRGGNLGMDQWDRYLDDLRQFESSALLSLTLFGAFSEAELPSEDEEVEGLALQRHLGNIDENCGRVLELGVGQSGSQRRAVLRQAVQG
jgi:hypothetical protein